MTQDRRDLRDLYERATDYTKDAFSDRPYFGGPAAPAQAETNVSHVWGHVNAGYLIGYEFTRWWKESKALREAAILGDWSWLNKVRISGADAATFMNYASVKNLSDQAVGQIMFTPMVNATGKLAIEGLTFRLAENEYLFTQSGAIAWLDLLKRETGMDIRLKDVTPDYTVYALQGPKSIDILEAVTRESFESLEFSRFRRLTLLDTDVIVARQGVTGETGYEFLMRTDTGRAPELWRTIREAGRHHGVRELGLRAQMIGHTEAGYPTAIRDYLPARVPVKDLARFYRHWLSREELGAMEEDLPEHLCSPAELGWDGLVDLDHEFHGQPALVEETDSGGPDRRFVGLVWNSKDVGELFASQFRDVPSAPPPPLASGPFRISFVEVAIEDSHIGWASGIVYSPTLRRLLSNGRIDRDAATPGTEVTVRWGDHNAGVRDEIRAEVVDQPIIEHGPFAT